MFSDRLDLLNGSFSESSVTELEKLLGSECKNVLLTGAPGSGKTSAVCEYIRRNSDKYDYVFFITYDREKYLDSSLSIDCILKKCLISPFINRGVKCGNYLNEFEKYLSENTLVVVDDYNIASLSPYMRHIASCNAPLIVVSECDMKTLPASFGRVYVENSKSREKCIRVLSSLSDEQKELLVTLCAMLYYLGDYTQISSSDRRVFDRQSLTFYLGNLSNHLDFLEQKGLVYETENGRIRIDKWLINYIISNFSPTADKCKTFMSFLDRYMDFYVIQDTKDLLAKFYITRDGDYSLVGTPELFDIYTHFCMTDKNVGFRLYNMFMALILQRIDDGKYEHLLMHNTGFFLKILCEELENGLAERIYDDELYLEDICPPYYSLSVRAKLDIIRICVSLLRGMTVDLYQESITLFKILYNTMSSLFLEISDSDIEDFEKCHLLDDCIRICSETFSYFSVFDKDGNYNKKRDDSNISVVSYIGEKYTDKKHAVSLAFGYSKETVLLYGIFQRFVQKWLELCSDNGISNRLLDAMYQEKMKDRKELFENISLHYCRIKEGFDVFSDFFDCKKKNTCIWNERLDDGFAKRLETNKHLLLRGFDNGTKTGAERYAEKVITAIRNSKNPKALFRIVLSDTYPVSDEFYKFLLDKRFVRLLSDNLDMSDKAKMEVLLFLVDNYNEHCGKQWKNRLFREIIAALYSKLEKTDASEERLYSCVCSMYLVNKTHNLLGKDTFADVLYEKVSKNYKGKTMSSHEHLAKVLHEYLSCGKKPKNTKKLKNAVDAVFFEYNTSDSKICIDGFYRISELLLGDINRIKELFGSK